MPLPGPPTTETCRLPIQEASSPEQGVSRWVPISSGEPPSWPAPAPGAHQRPWASSACGGLTWSRPSSSRGSSLPASESPFIMTQSCWTRAQPNGLLSTWSPLKKPPSPGEASFWGTGLRTSTREGCGDTTQHSWRRHTYSRNVRLVCTSARSCLLGVAVTAEAFRL